MHTETCLLMLCKVWHERLSSLAAVVQGDWGVLSGGSRVKGGCVCAKRGGEEGDGMKSV